MKTFLPINKTNDSEKQKDLLIGLTVTAVAVVVIGIIGLFIYSSIPKVVYEPTDACTLLTRDEAKSLLGDNTLLTGSRTPALSGNVATSRCGYTDGNADTDQAVVAAIVVRSGINSDGIAQNKAEFTNGRPTKDTKKVDNIGEAAYFNQKLGQLNVLDGKNWIILSYGIGSDPASNTQEDVVALAKKVVN